MDQPQIKIIEQPAEKSFRFRYESEKRLNGSIVGARSTSSKTSFPSIEIRNYTGRLLVMISCVTNEKNREYKQHPHKISSKKDKINGGVYTMQAEIQQSTVFEFKDIGIVFVKRENIKHSLEERKQMKVDPTKGGWDHMNRPQFIDLHCVRLCFQVYTVTECGGKSKLGNLGYVVSNPIMDKKSHGSLNIVELGASEAPVIGGKRIILLTDRVKREDIDVVFYFGITKMYTKLYRPSDMESSESVLFEFMPSEHSVLRRKRQKKMNDSEVVKLNSYVNQVENKTKFVPNVREYILIDLSDANNKENRPVPNSMQHYQNQGTYEAATRPVQPTYYPSTSQRMDENQYNYQPYTNHQNTNYDAMNHGQVLHSRPMHMLPNVYQHQQHQHPHPHQHQHQQQQQHQHQYQHQQPLTPNVFPNNVLNGPLNECNGHRMNVSNQPVNSAQCFKYPILNAAPESYHNDYNIASNKRADNFMMNTLLPSDGCPAQNIPNLSDLMQQNTSELIGGMVNIEELTDSMSSMEIKNFEK